MSTLLTSIAYQNEFKNCIIENQVSIITADTGSGKTMFATYFLKSLSYKIGVRSIITQPRIPNVFGVKSFIKQKYNLNVGIKIADEEIDVNNDTLIVTDGVLSARGHNLLNDYHVVVIDECHEFNANMEDILVLAKERLVVDPDFKVIILSATLDNHIDDIKTYFGEYKVCHKHFGGTPHNIEEVYSKETVFVEAANASKNGSVLVFLPSISDLFSYQRTMKLLYPNIRVQTLSSESDDKTRELIFNNEHNNIVWFATNIAQAGLTPANVNTVIITGFKYINRCDKYGNSVLEKVLISKEDFVQQKGRTGRMANGKCIIIMKGRRGKTYSYNDLPDSTPVEIQRMSLDTLYLRYCERDKKLENIKFVHKLNMDKVLESRNRLISEELITNDCIITDLGSKVSKLSASPVIGKAIVLSKQLKAISMTLLIAAIIETNSKIYNSFSEIDDSYLVKNSELLTTINIFRTFYKNGRCFDFDKNIKPSNLFKIAKIYKLLKRDVNIYNDDNMVDIDEIITTIFKKYIFVYSSGSYKNLYTNEYYSCNNFFCDFIFGIPTTIENNNIISFASELSKDIVFKNLKEYITESSHLDRNSDTGKIVKVTKYNIGGVTLHNTIDDTWTMETAKYLLENYAYSKFNEHRIYANSVFNYTNGEVDIRINYAEYIFNNNLMTVQDIIDNPIVFTKDIEVPTEIEGNKVEYNMDFSISMYLKTLDNIPVIEGKIIKYCYMNSFYTYEQLVNKIKRDKEYAIQNKVNAKMNEEIIIDINDFNNEPVDIDGTIIYPYMDRIHNDSTKIRVRYTYTENDANSYTERTLRHIQIDIEEEKSRQRYAIINDYEYDRTQYSFDDAKQLTYICEEIFAIDTMFYLGYTIKGKRNDIIQLSIETTKQIIDDDWKTIENIKLIDEYREKWFDYYNKVSDKLNTLNGGQRRELQSYYDTLRNGIESGSTELNENTFNELERKLNDENENISYTNDNIRFTSFKKRHK